MNMWKQLIILALAITVPWSKAVSTDNETSSRMDEEISQSMDAQGNDIIPLFELDNVLKECNKSFTIETSFLEELQQSGSFADETVKNPKCYIRCLLDLTGVTGAEEGKYDPAQAALLFSIPMNGESPKDDVEEMAKSCMENRGICAVLRSSLVQEFMHKGHSSGWTELGHRSHIGFRSRFLQQSVRVCKMHLGKKESIISLGSKPV